MKRTVIGIVAVIAIAVAVGLRAQQESKQSVGSHVGTWQLTSFKYGTNEPGFAEVPQTQRRVKLITDTHFTWVQFDTATKKIIGAAGGAYSLRGNTYTESVDFDLDMDSYLGQKHAFTMRVEGDNFFLSGALGDGLKIEEVWERVK